MNADVGLCHREGGSNNGLKNIRSRNYSYICIELLCVHIYICICVHMRTAEWSKEHPEAAEQR